MGGFVAWLAETATTTHVLVWPHGGAFVSGVLAAALLISVIALYLARDRGRPDGAPSHRTRPRLQGLRQRDARLPSAA
jgi:membrane protein implicated in regulation of membrane protease activity